MAQQKKDLNFEINLLPVISLLSVLISFLLLTAVWVNIGSMTFSQAYGENAGDTKENPPSLKIKMLANSGIQVILDKPSEEPRELVSIEGLNSEDNWLEFDSVLTQIKVSHTDLQTATILPTAQSDYDSLIKTMDRLRKHQILNVGISPL